MLKKRSPTPTRWGTYLVEFALVASLFILFLFGILEFGRFVMVRQVMTNAAREGARFAVVNTYTKTTADVQNQVDSMLGGLGSQIVGYNKTTTIEVYRADPVTGGPVDANGNAVTNWTLAPFTNAKFGQPIAVLITGQYKPIVPHLFFLNTTLTVQAKYMMYSEAN